MNLLARRSAGSALLALACTSAPAVAQTTDFQDHRAVWISRFEYNSQTSINQVIDRAAAAGFTDIYWQVRGQGDARYDSNFESWEATYGPTGPGFDPLEVAVTRADTNGVKIHAWINTIPFWRDSTFPNNPPSDPNHVYNLHPEWRLKDFNGNDEPIGSSYLGINPTHPDARAHLANVAGDIASRYGVAGVHMDYIRLIENSLGSPINYPADPDTRARYEADTGFTFTSSGTASYKQWVSDQITLTVQGIDAAVKAADPNLKTTAAVWRDFNIGNNDYRQDAGKWVDDGDLDIAHPMIYTTNDALFRQNLLLYRNRADAADISAGLGSYLHGGDPGQTLDQLTVSQALGANGYTIFSYGSIYSGSSLTAIGQDVQQFNADLQARDDAGLIGMAVSDFDDDEGYFNGSPTASGSNVGITAATAALDATEALTGVGQSQRISIAADQDDWFLRHLAGSGSPGNNLEMLAQGYVGFWLKTETEGLSTRIAIDDVEGTAERGFEKNIIADGEWHLYEWDLSDDGAWEGWINGDGLVEGNTITLDSIQFFGDNAGGAVIFLDDVSFNPFGSLSTVPIMASDFNGDGAVDLIDFDILSSNFGTVGGKAQGDANGDGVVTLLDFDVLAQEFGSGSPAVTNIPEPASALLLGAPALLALRRRRA
ncbi:MAG: family 10 glycosylhydrolase [Planctomycetota bacterium]